MTEASRELWQGYTPTGDDLEGMPLTWFHAAVDELIAETVDEGDIP